MPNKALQNTCIVCGRLLEPEVCVKCRGTGQVKGGLLGKRACKACAGTGRVQVCPDWSTHVANWQSGRDWAPQKPTGGAAIPIHQTCPLCKGTKGIRMPFTGQAGPCPRCKGKGWV
jgi:DnaJ-class molecular chaperone